MRPNAGLALFVISVAAACGGTSITTTDGGSDDGSTDGGTDPDAPPGCDPLKDPKDSLLCLDNGFGIFVSPKGIDTNPGTKEAPLLTFAAALTKVADTNKHRIYACEGTYDEDVVMDEMHAASIYGGWSCPGWSYDTKHANIGHSQRAMMLDHVKRAIVLEDIGIESSNAMDGTAAARTSLALFANGCASVTVRRSTVSAGNGAQGVLGDSGDNYLPLINGSTDAQIAGIDSPGLNGGGAHACNLCIDMKQSTGGGGGGGTASPTDGQDGSPNLNGTNPIDGKGGVKDMNNMGCLPGHLGPDGAAGKTGTGTAVLGKLTPTGWVAASGDDGVNGGVAQGGGGGGGNVNNSKGGGGGGGCGGCGGGGGKGGTGGGGSIAVASLGSSLSFFSSVIITGAAGNGGPGGPAQVGQTGGIYGLGNGGCNGGRGGNGGAGGAGGGGAGGISVGVVFTGSMPTVDDPKMIMVGANGKKGSGPMGNDGIDGVSQPTLMSP